MIPTRPRRALVPAKKDDPLLLVDTNYLCHRAYHAMPDLTFKDMKTGVVYGVLRDVLSLRNTFQSNRIAFCFDSSFSLRKAIYPKYKANRGKAKNETDKELRGELSKQIDLLFTDYLPALGVKNTFAQYGYEADDIIASIVDNAPGRKIIVTADSDMFQLLGHSTSIYNPRLGKLCTVQDFVEVWRITPADWARCKAIAGDVPDNIKGIKGVGLKIAAKFIRGELNPDTATYAKINRENLQLITHNIRLTRLPFPDVGNFPIEKNDITPARWKALCEKLGMKTLKDRLEDL